MFRKKIKWIILDSIFLIVFNILFFVWGEIDHYPSVWIAYGFIHFSYLMLLITPLFMIEGKNMAIFGYPLFTMSTLYFIAQFLTGLIFIYLSQESYKMSLSVQLSLAGLYGMILITLMIANEKTAEAVDDRQIQINYVKEATVRVKILLDNAKDKESMKMIEAAFVIINSSPVKSHPSLSGIEDNIINLIQRLEDCVNYQGYSDIKTITDSLVRAMNERNTKLRLFN